MTPVDPHTMFPRFYSNPAIRALADACRWTISGQIADEDPDNEADKPPTRKAPIDLRHLIDRQRVRGAWSIGPECLVTLAELTSAVPAAANHAFYLQAQTDGLIVIDIESGCPPKIAADLLRLPGILYSELSMSGRGFHLVFPLPGNLHNFPVAAGKLVLREQHGWYEILLDHWCTFTRFPIADVTREHIAAVAWPPAFTSVEEVYADLAAKARPSAGLTAAAVGTDAEMPEIPYAQSIIEKALASAEGLLRDPRDFDHDLSRWEFSVLAVLYRWMQVPLSVYSSFGVCYSAGDQAWLLYRAALDVIPARPKHAQQRNGRPFLLDRAAALIAEREAAAEQQKDHNRLLS